MKTYLVGGAVRDTLLNATIYDRDWVVVGATPQEMLKNGFIQVGKDFPVFLHPETKEEYALARTERKSGKGYTGFICDFNQDITLEQDLLRRDLTMNAIALDELGNYIDPYHGIDDINQRILRHVSPAFAEDPLRVLRVARFAAKYANYGFVIAPETMALMSQIVDSGEINHLTAERVWKEAQKALATENPHIFFEVLRACNALAILFPELNNLFSLSLSQKSHSATLFGEHTLLALKQSVTLTDDLEVRFAVLCIDFGKRSSHDDQSTSNGILLINGLCERLKIANNYKKIANIVRHYHSEVHNIARVSAEKLLTLLNGIDAWRNPEHLEKLILGCLADFNSQQKTPSIPYPQAEYLRQAYLIAKTVSIQDIIKTGMQGEEIKNTLISRRIIAIKAWQKIKI